VHELALEARALTKRFGRTVALDGLDLHVERGESLAILGDTGAGKSVALRLFAGLSRASSGSVAVLGAKTRSRAALAARRHIGYVRQAPAFPDWMTGREQLAFAADLLGLGRATAGEQLDAALEQVGLANAGEQRLVEYSPAMRQRLELGQALLGDPELLLLDEPLGWIEPAGRAGIFGLLGRLRGAVTLVLATSDLRLAEATCDRLAVLDRGRLLAVAPALGLLDRFAPPDYVLETGAGPGLALAGLSARLRQEPWVRDLSSVDGALRISVHDEERAEQELYPAIASTGLAVRELRRERPEVGVLVERLRGDQP
jgi:ABC-2 type transport system ATP-binding protein